MARRREGAAEPSPEAPIDRAYLARFTLDNAALEREVLELFAQQAPIYLQQLRAARSAKAWREAAHTLKGSAVAVGARHVARLAELAERLAIEQGADAAGGREKAVGAVAAAVEEACRHIARLFAAPGRR
jgi:HPt (histidine-containing phosphotransfer) domain-containing protein